MSAKSIDEKVRKLELREASLKNELAEIAKQKKLLFLKRRESLLKALEKAGCDHLSDEEIIAALTAIKK